MIRLLDPRLLTFLAARTDVVFAAFFMLMVAILVIPVSPLMIDVLVAANLAFTIVILMTALYLKSVLDFSTFPAIVLISTVFRLALTVSSTRMILSSAEAGSIIRGFGDFVLGGQVLVGLVVFVILALVQFLVVTKGAERIAEVSARFTLDAMPGKQLAVDNDLRNGAITAEAAMRRRFLIEKESQFFGAMDGAMKFVKGDAIASITIAFVNLIGGLLIGVISHKMSFSDAGSLYALLTVGEGLVSQIPAMLTSISAGVVVTRVATDVSSSLGTDIGRQVTNQPMSLWLSAGTIGLLAAVPGFPAFVLLGIAVVIGGGAFLMGRSARLAQMPASAPEEPPELRRFERPSWGDPIIVRARAEIIEALEDGKMPDFLEAALREEARIGGFAIVVPKFDPQAAVGQGALDVFVEGIVVARLTRVLDNSGPHLAKLLAGLSRRHSAAIFSVSDLEQWLTETEGRLGRLVAEAKACIPPARMVETMRILLAEGIPVGYPRALLETMLSPAAQNADAPHLAALCREAMMPQIIEPYLDAARNLHVVTMEDAFEARLFQAVMGRGDARAIAQILERLADALRGAGQAENAEPILLLRRAPRLPVTAALARAGVRAMVLSASEAPSEVALVVSAVIGEGQASAADASGEAGERPQVRASA